MSDSTTTNYGWSYPTVNADSDTWGTTVNATIIAIDGQMKTNATAACQTAHNLSDLANAGTARTNLGLGTAATHAATDFALASAALLAANNLSDLGTVATARTNLGLGTAAVKNITVSASTPSGGSDGDLWFQ